MLYTKQELDHNEREVQQCHKNYVILFTKTK
mgnify:CR=1 FL=1